MKKILLSIIITMASLILLAQDPGDLNLAFGHEGIYFENWMDTLTYSHEIRWLANGNFVIPGCYETGSSCHALVMAFDERGVPLEFGNFKHGFGEDFGRFEEANGLVTLPDNKILIAGYGYIEGKYLPFAARLLSDGSLDESFGENGIFTDETIHMYVYDVEIFQELESYQIILSGKNHDISCPQMIMLDETGDLVASFGTSGIVNYEDHNGTFSELEIDNTNEYLFAIGHSNTDAGVDSNIIVKYSLPEGIPVTDFGEDGMLLYSKAGGFNGSIRASILDKENNTLTVFGDYEHAAGDHDIFGYRLNATNGNVDNTFGVAGWSTLRSPVSDDFIYAAIRQSDGKYYIGGDTDYFIDRKHDFLVGRLTSNGAGDTTFGTNGLVVTDIGGHNNYIEGISLSPNEDILYTTGYCYTGSPYDAAITVAAYHTGYISDPVTGLIEDQTNSVIIYPNPTMTSIMIVTGINGTHRVQVMDMEGREVISSTWKGESCDLDLGNLPPSVYFIRITQPGMQPQTVKLVKR